MLQVVGVVCYGVRPERSLGSLDLSLGLKQYMAKTRGLNKEVLWQLAIYHLHRASS